MSSESYGTSATTCAWPRHAVHPDPLGALTYLMAVYSVFLTPAGVVTLTTARVAEMLKSTPVPQ